MMHFKPPVCGCTRLVWSEFHMAYKCPCGVSGVSGATVKRSPVARDPDWPSRVASAIGYNPIEEDEKMSDQSVTDAVKATNPRRARIAARNEIGMVERRMENELHVLKRNSSDSTVRMLCDSLLADLPVRGWSTTSARVTQLLRAVDRENQRSESGE